MNASTISLACLALCAAPALASAQAPTLPSPPPPASSPSESDASWHYNAFVDVGYLYDRNDPENQIFRGRGTAWHLNDWYLDMAGVSLKKKATEQSRWGVELAAHAGKDDEIFGFSATAPNIGGYEWLRHIGLANVSYLAPLGKGLTVQGGIFNSFIGYDSLYAKDNFEYTRPWGADFTPYLMMGVNASYPFTDRLTGTVFVINGYWHLADANHVPTMGGQVAHMLTPNVTLKETAMVGPHQADTSFTYWRVLSDTLIERKTDPLTVAFEYQYASERVSPAEAGDGLEPGARALWMSAQMPIHWHVRGPWSVTLRPEVAWDRDGRWTLARQTVKAATATVEYRAPIRQATAIFRFEYRVDDSRGPQGGFFERGEVSPGVPRLTPTQPLVIAGLILTFDGQTGR